MVSAAGVAPAITRAQAEHVAATPRAGCPGVREGAGDLVLVEMDPSRLGRSGSIGEWRLRRDLHPHSARRQRAAFLFSYGAIEESKLFREKKSFPSLYKTVGTQQIKHMNFENPLVWIGAGLVLFVILVVFIAPKFSTASRLERRRRKSNARIVSKTGKPTVKFSVRTKDKK